MIGRIFKLRRDRRGTATIELALFAPVLATMTVGVIDMSMAFSRKLQLEQAAQRAIEKVMQTTGVDTPAATIIAEAADQADIAAENVSVSYILECDQEPVEDYDAECADDESEARYIEVEVTDKYEPMLGITFAGLDSDGTYHINAKAGMRTQ
jgi:hypothetical protein